MFLSVVTVSENHAGQEKAADTHQVPDPLRSHPCLGVIFSDPRCIFMVCRCCLKPLVSLKNVFDEATKNVDFIQYWRLRARLDSLWLRAVLGHCWQSSRLVLRHANCVLASRFLFSFKEGLRDNLWFLTLGIWETFCQKRLQWNCHFEGYSWLFSANDKIWANKMIKVRAFRKPVFSSRCCLNLTVAY